MPRIGSERGFTLLEVLIAFAILVVMMLPLSRSFSLGMFTAERTDSVTDATLLAQSALDTLGHAANLADGTTMERQHGPYRTSETVQRYHGPGFAVQADAPIVPFRLTVVVRWQEGARTRSLSLHTLQLRPGNVSAAPR